MMVAKGRWNIFKKQLKPTFSWCLQSPVIFIINWLLFTYTTLYKFREAQFFFYLIFF